MASEQLAAIDGLYKLRKWIEDRGLKRAAVTNAPRANVEFMVSRLGLSDFFQAVVLGCECEHAKPHPEPYLRALELLEVSKEHTIVFEVCVVFALYCFDINKMNNHSKTVFPLND